MISILYISIAIRWSVNRSVIIFLRGRKLHFHYPIGVLVIYTVANLIILISGCSTYLDRQLLFSPLLQLYVDCGIEGAAPGVRTDLACSARILKLSLKGLYVFYTV